MKIDNQMLKPRAIILLIWAKKLRVLRNKEITEKYISQVNYSLTSNFYGRTIYIINEF
jgi:hypothetical protein